MQKTDEMIALATLYNKISDKYTSIRTRESTFKTKVEELVSKGIVSTEAGKDALYCFIPAERASQIDEYKENTQNKESPYSSLSVAKRFEDLIDEVLSDTPSFNLGRSSLISDPCTGCGPISRSSC